jgi:hypothetical protein
MRTLRIVLGGLSALAAVAAAASSQAAVVYNTTLTDGVYFGSGNPNGAFAVDTENGIEIGLRAKISGIHPQITPVGNVYSIPLGQTFNFDYSFDPYANGLGSEASIAGLSELITITDAFGFSTSFDPSLSLLGNSHLAGGPDAFQNSEKISFGFLQGAGYNPNLNDTYNVTFSVSNAAGAKLLSVNNIVNIGAGAGGVPEPASWALMIMGFGAVGATLRRRRTAAFAA